MKKTEEKGTKNAEKTPTEVQDSNILDKTQDATIEATLSEALKKELEDVKAQKAELEKQLSDTKALLSSREKELDNLSIQMDELNTSKIAELQKLKAEFDVQTNNLILESEAKQIALQAEIDDLKKELGQASDTEQSAPRIGIKPSDMLRYAQYYTTMDPKSGRHPMGPLDFLLTFPHP